MTKNELRVFAKNNGVSLKEAREMLKEKAKEEVNQNPAFGEQTLYSRDQLVKDSSPVGMVNLVDGASLFDELRGPVNVQIFGATGDSPIFHKNTKLAASYVGSLLSGGKRVKEFMGVYGDRNKEHVVVSFIGRKGDGKASLLSVLRSLPDEMKSFVEKNIGLDIVDGLVSAPFYATEATTEIGIV